jgi:hypothetical protein
MEEKVILITTKAELRNTLHELLSEKQFVNAEPNFEEDRLSRFQASRLAGISLPTFQKRVNEGFFRVHGSGRKKFFLRSEIIKALKNV